MGNLPLDTVTGLLPPGRYAMTLDDMYEDLVAKTRSTTRQQIWNEWEQHRASVEAFAGEITRMWAAGSFVSGKPEPSDIDVTYFLRAEAYDRLDPESLADLADLTERSCWVEMGMRVDAHLVRLPKMSLYLSDFLSSFR